LAIFRELVRIAACADCGSTEMVGIVRVIGIVVVEIKGCNY
jgi:hypothetical protein